MMIDKILPLEIQPFLESKVNTMAIAALAPCVTRQSAAMVSIT